MFFEVKTMNYVYQFPVVKGVQANQEYYIAMVPLKMLIRLFPEDEEYVLPEFRAQRRLNASRIPVMKNYILKNRNNYVFSALAASIDGELKYKPNKDELNTGILEVAMDSKFLINDGQHRKAAILAALEEDKSLGEETISVVFFKDNGLTRSQQIFTDLNKHAVKTSNSISELYDSRDPLAVITRNTVLSVSFLNQYTDKEKDNLGKYSSNLFTLNTFYKANKRILGSKKISHHDKNDQAFLENFWALVVNNIVPWNEMRDHELSKKDLRENYIVTQNVVIQALGRIGNYFYNNKKSNMPKTLIKLKDVNWKRTADIWQQRSIKPNGRIIANEEATILTGNVIKQLLGIPLAEDEETKELEFVRLGFGGLNNAG